ncbi:hypothetical protein KLEB273_gp123 [Bacillus phage vB_BauM_KLEB27-3]|nr:hypothetical protein KLEB273_gp123 [Bacillus phage vB_BauM_KLEB27-3]
MKFKVLSKKTEEILFKSKTSEECRQFIIDHYKSDLTAVRIDRIQKNSLQITLR